MATNVQDRIGAAGGLLFVVLAAVGGVAGGQPPAAGAPPDRIATYLADHRDALEAGVWLLGVGVVALSVWFGSLWRYLFRPTDDSAWGVVSLLGLALTGSLALTSSVTSAVAAGEDAGLAPPLYRLGAMLLSAEGFGLTAHLLATNWTAVRSGMAPSWLATLGGVAAAGFLVAAVLGAEGIDVNDSLGLASFVLWCAWITGVSVLLWSGRMAAASAGHA